MNPLTSHAVLEQLAGGPLPEWDAFASTIRTRTFAAGDTLFAADVHWPWLNIVREGLVKLVYLRADGSERIKSFIPAGGFFASLAGLASGGVTTFSAVAMTAGAIEQLSYPQILALGERHLAWQKALRVGIEHYGARKEKRERELLMLKAEQRYRQFLDESPELAAQVPLKDLALYLGITPVALSRIRGRLAMSGAKRAAT